MAGCSQRTWKNTRFRAPASSPTQAPCNIHAAITMHFAAPRTHPCRQPLQCDLHPLVAEHRGGTDDLETIQTAPAAHRRYPSSPAAATLHGKTHGFVLQLPPQKPAPCNIHAAIKMHFAAPCTHPCSHYIAICIHSLQNTEEEPIDLETIQAAPAAHRRYPSSPAAATLHGKTHGFVLPLPLQKQPHATFMQPLQCAFAAPRTHPCSHWNAICIHPLQNTGGTD